MSVTTRVQHSDTSLAKALENLRALHTNRPSVRLAADKDPRTGATIEKILNAAQVTFIEDGASGLTLRQVAEMANIAVGNLTYHFPSKDSLIRATLEEYLSRFAREHLNTFYQEAESPLETVLMIVTFYVRDAHNSHGFFHQLWGYAASGDNERALVRESYNPIGLFILSLIGKANPALDYKQKRRIVLQLFSLAEGYRIFIGMGPDDDIALANAETDIRNLARQLIMNPIKT